VSDDPSLARFEVALDIRSVLVEVAKRDS